MWIIEDDSYAPPEMREVHGHADLDPACTDIVYKILYTNGQAYIGKKAVRAMRKYPPLKGKKRCRRKMKDLPFVNYEGSHEDAEGLTIEAKYILYQCSTRKASTYLEAALLFEYDAILGDEYLNKNISGKFFANDLNGLIYDILYNTRPTS